MVARLLFVFLLLLSSHGWAAEPPVRVGVLA
jgi:hypothetical protein